MGMTAAESRARAASNKLYCGEVASVVEALRTLVNGLRAQEEANAEFNAALTPNEQCWRLAPDTFTSYRTAAQQALAIWREEIQAAEERALARVRALDTEDATNIADALESGAWDTLAW